MYQLLRMKQHLLHLTTMLSLQQLRYVLLQMLLLLHLTLHYQTDPKHKL